MQKNEFKNLIILTGASGSGKTTISRTIATNYPQIICLFFDSIGVPSSQEMIQEYESVENWQKEKTKEWIKRIQNEYLHTTNVLFEGQMRIAFVLQALQENNLSAKVILIDCDDDVRTNRLTNNRNQPELANPEMMNWAAFLRQEAKENRISIFDNSRQSLIKSVNTVMIQLLNFRNANLDDLPAIIGLYLDDDLGSKNEVISDPLLPSYLNDFQAIQDDPNQSLYVITLENEIVGTFQLTLIPGLLYKGATRLNVEAVVIKKQYQSIGIGSWMFDKIFEFAKDKNAIIIQLTTNKIRKRAKIFYERLGFRTTHEGMKLHLK